ncbi:hypothetical protein DPX39_050045100 [Trypanosoma brucei equiperdum]|uniref:Uncharacterized protein n=1 Tax=Trypanosoma brucei equiperdum TaxID=630700 RepID=A0A3L6L6X7_9TRYP|nr:hypothetical protein DPX39_050045100 [Trypanosoma brucei equiperdum]
MHGASVGATTSMLSAAVELGTSQRQLMRTRCFRSALRCGFRAVPPLLFTDCSQFLHQQRNASSFNKFEAVSYAGRSRNVANAFNPLELNLFDDPTGGLTAGPAEELPSTDIASQVRLCVATYSRHHYYLLFTPFVDVMSIVFQLGLAPNVARPGEVMARWFTDAVATLQNPSCMEEVMGLKAWQRLCEGLDKFYEDVEPVMPLTAAVRKHGLPENLLVPFMRQLAMDLLLPARRRGVVEILPGLILGLANGRAPPELGFPEAAGAAASTSTALKGAAEELQRKRATMAADLFLGVGQETGNTDFAYLGIQLLRANDIAVPFPKQKQLTNVFSAATRIQTDWQMRVSGQLMEVLPKWMDYYKTVYSDNMRAIKKLHEKSETIPERGNIKNPAASRGNKQSQQTQKGGDESDETRCTDVGSDNGDDGMHDYFTSNRRENIARVADLESRIEECVRKRDIEWRDDGDQLYRRFKRKKSLAAGGSLKNDVTSEDVAEGKDQSSAKVVDAEGLVKAQRQTSMDLGDEDCADVASRFRVSTNQAPPEHLKKGMAEDNAFKSASKYHRGTINNCEEEEIWEL